MTANRFESDDNKKYYHWKNEDEFQSVTSILDSLPTGWALKNWGDIQIANFAVQRYED